MVFKIKILKISLYSILSSHFRKILPASYFINKSLKFNLAWHLKF